jgi:hypothetical protein
MPELTTEYFYHCKSADHWEINIAGKTGNYTVTYGSMNGGNVQKDYSCTCMGFGFRKTCKHVEEVKASGIHCGWMQYIDGGELKDGKCPECSNDVESMGWGV